MAAATSLTIVFSVSATAVSPAATAPATPPPSRFQHLPVAPNVQLVRTALSYRGARYRFGGTGRNGFDCSGFMRYVYNKQAGVGLPRTAAQQFRSGRKIALNDLQPGDLLFFRTRGRYVGHVGMYAGNNRMVHAANPRRGVTTDALFGSYWARRLVGIRRPVG